MALVAKIELKSSRTHVGNGRKFEKGIPQIISNPADIRYYQNQSGFDVTFINKDATAKAKKVKTKKAKTKKTKKEKRRSSVQRRSESNIRDTSKYIEDDENDNSKYIEDDENDEEDDDSIGDEEDEGEGEEDDEEEEEDEGEGEEDDEEEEEDDEEEEEDDEDEGESEEKIKYTKKMLYGYKKTELKDIATKMGLEVGGTVDKLRNRILKASKKR